MEDTHRSQYRLPWSLYKQLKAASEKSRRPLNAELVSRLESTFPQLVVKKELGTDELHATISKMSLLELMTPLEITTLIERMLEGVSRNTDPPDDEQR